MVIINRIKLLMEHFIQSLGSLVSVDAAKKIQLLQQMIKFMNSKSMVRVNILLTGE